VRSELDVVQREADLAGELGEAWVVMVVEGDGAVGSARHHEAEQLA